MAPKAKAPRPPKVELPPTKPAKQSDFNDKVWAAIKDLQGQIDRLATDDDTRAARAKALKERQ